MAHKYYDKGKLIEKNSGVHSRLERNGRWKLYICTIHVLWCPFGIILLMEHVIMVVRTHIWLDIKLMPQIPLILEFTVFYNTLLPHFHSLTLLIPAYLLRCKQYNTKHIHILEILELFFPIHFLLSNWFAIILCNTTDTHTHIPIRIYIQYNKWCCHQFCTILHILWFILLYIFCPHTCVYTVYRWAGLCQWNF